jgi:hypothetical protein
MAFATLTVRTFLTSCTHYSCPKQHHYIMLELSSRHFADALPLIKTEKVEAFKGRAIHLIRPPTVATVNYTPKGVVPSKEEYPPNQDIVPKTPKTPRTRGVKFTRSPQPREKRRSPQVIVSDDPTIKKIEKALSELASTRKVLVSEKPESPSKSKANPARPETKPLTALDKLKAMNPLVAPLTKPLNEVCRLSNQI